MRIQHVRFKNLNSLVGEWEIDLTHSAFAADGIFAITGPTGAGKSTLLDAICLALYGRTPRLPKVTKSGNEILSRRTGECFAEVTFETQTGRYRCHWSQHRARKKPNGELQAPKHEMANADSGQIFESKMKGVADHIASVTGMDFERFTRSMLLAQGGFAAFLQASADDRAPILEQITGTVIYSQISIRVHERQREEKDKLHRLQAETAGIVTLDPEQEQIIVETLGTYQKDERVLTAQWADTGKALAWLSALEALNAEIGKLTAEANDLQVEIAAFQPDRERWGHAVNAAGLDGVFATLAALRQQQADDSAALTVQEAALPELESAFNAQTAALNIAEEQTAHAKKAWQVAHPILQKIRSLDQKIADRESVIKEYEKSVKDEAARVNADQKARLEALKKQARVQETQRQVDDDLRAHAQDEGLVGGLTGIEAELGRLGAEQEAIVKKATQQKTAMKAQEQAIHALAERQKHALIQKQTWEDASRHCEARKDALRQLLDGRLLREYRTEKETRLREMAFLEKIAKLEEARAKLEDGQPCPLCGSTVHPFAEGNVPESDEIKQVIDALTARIRDAEDQEAAIVQYEAAKIEAHNRVQDAEKQVLMAENAAKTVEQNLSEINEDMAKRHADFAESRRGVLARLQPFGISDIPEIPVLVFIEDLRSRLKAWQARVKKKADVEKEKAEIDSQILQLDAVIDTRSRSLEEKKTTLCALKAELETDKHERHAQYGNTHPDEEERRLNKAMADTELAERHARAEYHALEQQWNTAKAHLESLKKRIEARTPEHQRQEAAFADALTALGFPTEASFLAARLSPEQKAELAARAKYLDDRQTELAIRQKDRETRLAAEKARNLTSASPDALQGQLTEQEDALKVMRESIAGLQHKLNEQAAGKARIREKQAAMEVQKKECRRWDNLHELIGSADGKKYRNFAQGLTFDILIFHANRQLQKMSNRYLLIRDAAQPLELNVIDNDQAGEIRSTKNLSGGESFIVSLSLALGLSQMASQNVRVDSLFLDEGFGTLDEQALSTALETLSALPQDGKLIGVISHVSALKERIRTQIEVRPQAGGRSRLSGPGCRSVTETAQ
jgi:DNA repair protein SbcC/Rad50